jgi:hypothetical protein
MKARYFWLPVVIASSFLAGTLVSTGRAQQSPRKPPKYIQVDYMKVQPANENDYVKLEQEQWKPIHQERIKQGKIRSWYFFGVGFPSGSETKYNFVTVNTFDQWGQLENPYADSVPMVQKVHPGTNIDEFLTRTSKARELVRTEVWELIDQAE